MRRHSKAHLFCFFSGYVKNKNRVISIDQDDQLGILKITLNVHNPNIFSKGEYIGLSGSSLTTKEVVYTEDKIFFSIYCGRETRENTHFNQDLKVNTPVDITAPYQIITKSNL